MSGSVEPDRLAFKWASHVGIYLRISVTQASRSHMNGPSCRWPRLRLSPHNW